MRFRRIGLMALLALSLCGCELQQPQKLDSTDMKIAAFYSDYLLVSGAIVPDAAPVSEFPEVSAQEIDTLFVHHGIDQKVFNDRLARYSRNPALWRNVLVQVRKNLRGRS